MLHGGQKPGDSDYYDFSFSGLKTAVLLAVRDAERRGALAVEAPTIARGFQDALIGALVAKTVRAAEAFGRTRIVLGGGVACNRALVAAMRTRAGEAIGAASVHAPGPRLATDNAAMIARAALFRLARGERSGADLNAYASQSLPGLVHDGAAA
jgi:N6-L-threonylcarbamoyladenine synthase